MFSTKNLIHQITDVPNTWIFEHYCSLKAPLKGEDVKIKSLFNPLERTPSMCIYVDDKSKSYRFKDFSTGKGGDHVTLVKELYSINYGAAIKTIVADFNDFILHNNGGYDLQEFKEHAKYKVDKLKFRTWSTQDQYFWTQFNIGSKLLEKYNVRALEYYTMVKEDKEIRITGNYIYGYFKADGTIYKLYQPKNKDKKFLKISDFIQGSEQLEGHPVLIIASSLKDIMSLKTLKLNVDVIAPDSENSIIKKSVIDEYRKKYRTILSLFDNDEAGISAMKKYRDELDIPPILLTMSKDLSDSIRDHGKKAVIQKLVPLINKNL